jgi:hypothetical protein
MVGMRRRAPWLVVAGVFTAINVAGGVYALFQGEMMHALSHAVLTVVGIGWMLRLAMREEGFAAAALPNQRVEQLQQSVDNLAVQVERIGEAQRYLAKVAADRPGAARPPDDTR